MSNEQFQFKDDTVLKVDVLLPVATNGMIQLSPFSLYLIVDSSDTLEQVNVMAHRLNPNASIQEISIVEDLSNTIDLVNQDGTINSVTLQTLIDNRKELYK